MAAPSGTTKLALKPSTLVLFFRTFLLYQLWRFAVLNVRMLQMIGKSH